MRHDRQVGMRPNRRQVIRLLGSAPALGLVWPEWNGLAFESQTFTKPTFPKGAVIRTIFADVPPEALDGGATLFHEHLSLAVPSSPGAVSPNERRPGRYTEDVDLMREELRATAREGVRCIVDAGSIGDIDQLRKIAAAVRSEMHIVAAGGYFVQPRYPPEVAHSSEDQLAEKLAARVREERWGAFGEIGTSMEMHPDERKVLRAVGRAHLRTGIPILTHMPHDGCRKCGLEQLDVFEALGVNPQSVCIGHLSDIWDEPKAETCIALARRGAFLGFDTVGHQVGKATHAQKIAMILSILDAGYGDRLLLSSDLAREPLMKRNWGAGYSTVLAIFVPKMRYAGIQEETIRSILVDNPRRFLAFVPKSG
jgi:phosphotriesterase-related protein